MMHNAVRHGFILVAVGLACLPTIASAQSDMMTRVERTPSYDVVLSIDPVASSSSMMGHMDDQSMTMTPHMADQGMAVNHWLDIHVSRADSGDVVNDLTPTIRITDKATGESRDLPGVMGMSSGMNATDFHYGQNVFLPDGTYLVTVQLGADDAAQFRDVMVMAAPMMDMHAQP
jgi:hypothetical protein